MKSEENYRKTQRKGKKIVIFSIIAYLSSIISTFLIELIFGGNGYLLGFTAILFPLIILLFDVLFLIKIDNILLKSKWMAVIFYPLFLLSYMSANYILKEIPIHESYLLLYHPDYVVNEIDGTVIEEPVLSLVSELQNMNTSWSSDISLLLTIILWFVIQLAFDLKRESKLSIPEKKNTLLRIFEKQNKISMIDIAFISIFITEISITIYYMIKVLLNPELGTMGILMICLIFSVGVVLNHTILKRSICIRFIKYIETLMACFAVGCLIASHARSLQAFCLYTVNSFENFARVILQL